MLGLSDFGKVEAIHVFRQYFFAGKPARWNIKCPDCVKNRRPTVKAASARRP
jgi:hypothetical protein